MENPRESANCPYCLSPIEENAETIRCPICGVLHHAECWQMNGKCSVYGCDGWQAWSSEITDKIAPKIQAEIDMHETGAEPSANTTAQAKPLCIECGAPVNPGQLTCARCRKISRPAILDNCLGPSVIILIGLAAVVSLLLKGFG